MVLDREYGHEHGVSIGKNVRSGVARQRLREESVMYYFREYLQSGRGMLGVARVWFMGVRGETVLVDVIGGLLRSACGGH